MKVKPKSPITNLGKKVFYSAKKNTDNFSDQQVLIEHFADLMVNRLFQDIDKTKKLYTDK